MCLAISANSGGWRLDHGRRSSQRAFYSHRTSTPTHICLFIRISDSRMAIFTLHSSSDENQPPTASKRRSFFKTVSSRTSLVLAPLRRSSVSNTIGNAKDDLDSPSHEAAFDFELLDVAYAIGAGFLSLDEDATQSTTNATERRVPSPELDEPTPLSRNSSDQGTPRRASVTKKFKRFDASVPVLFLPFLSRLISV
jgi:hypothetical protein